MSKRCEILRHELDGAERTYRSAGWQLGIAVVWLVIGLMVCVSDVTCGGLITVTGFLGAVLMYSNRVGARNEVERADAEWRKAVED